MTSETNHQRFLRLPLNGFHHAELVENHDIAVCRIHPELFVECTKVIPTEKQGGRYETVK